MAVSRGGRPATGTGAVRKFPTGANYAEALQHPELCFRDPDLRHGTVQQSPVLGPKAISGNFASVFSVTARDGQRYALKCFTRDTSAIGVRYAAISTALRALDTGGLSQPWSVRFEFLEQGVLALGDWFPVVRMADQGHRPHLVDRPPPPRLGCRPRPRRPLPRAGGRPGGPQRRHEGSLHFSSARPCPLSVQPMLAKLVDKTGVSQPAGPELIDSAKVEAEPQLGVASS
ncbi:hypothetical protein SFUMM280S_09031 [Streptomyces fumanus]